MVRVCEQEEQEEVGRTSLAVSSARGLFCGRLTGRTTTTSPSGSNSASSSTKITATQVLAGPKDEDLEDVAPGTSSNNHDDPATATGSGCTTSTRRQQRRVSMAWLYPQLGLLLLRSYLDYNQAGSSRCCAEVVASYVGGRSSSVEEEKENNRESTRKTASKSSSLRATSSSGKSSFSERITKKNTKNYPVQQELLVELTPEAEIVSSGTQTQTRPEDHAATRTSDGEIFFYTKEDDPTGRDKQLMVVQPSSKDEQQDSFLELQQKVKTTTGAVLLASPSGFFKHDDQDDEEDLWDEEAAASAAGSQPGSRGAPEGKTARSAVSRNHLDPLEALQLHVGSYAEFADEHEEVPLMQQKNDDPERGEEHSSRLPAAFSDHFSALQRFERSTDNLGGNDKKKSKKKDGSGHKRKRTEKPPGDEDRDRKRKRSSENKKPNKSREQREGERQKRRDGKRAESHLGPNKPRPSSPTPASRIPPRGGPRPLHGPGGHLGGGVAAHGNMAMYGGSRGNHGGRHAGHVQGGLSPGRHYARHGEGPLGHFHGAPAHGGPYNPHDHHRHHPHHPPPPAHTRVHNGRDSLENYFRANPDLLKQIHAHQQRAATAGRSGKKAPPIKRRWREKKHHHNEKHRSKAGKSIFTWGKDNEDDWDEDDDEWEECHPKDRDWNKCIEWEPSSDEDGEWDEMYSSAELSEDSEEKYYNTMHPSSADDHDEEHDEEHEEHAGHPKKQHHVHGKENHEAHGKHGHGTDKHGKNHGHGEGEHGEEDHGDLDHEEHGEHDAAEHEEDHNHNHAEHHEAELHEEEHDHGHDKNHNGELQLVLLISLTTPREKNDTYTTSARAATSSGFHRLSFCRVEENNCKKTKKQPLSIIIFLFVHLVHTRFDTDTEFLRFCCKKMKKFTFSQLTCCCTTGLIFLPQF
ncbi:unnamed protein product [Amoebophrya sp. A120]|nr:unnamed protein product [Amoebophrya sp. A120]|eukprot:GSA120T00022144001.1